MKQIIFLFGFFALISCKSQIDLNLLKFGEKISFSNNLQKGSSVYIPLTNIYSVKDISNFKYGNISIKPEKISLKDEGMEPQNTLSIVTDSSMPQHYLGFEIELINEKTSDEFLELLRQQHGQPIKQHEDIEGNYKDVQYLWEDKAENRIIYFKKHNEEGHVNAKNASPIILSKTVIIILKNGLKAQVDNNDPRNNPEKIKDILSANPNAFDIFEIFKNEIPD